MKRLVLAALLVTGTLHAHEIGTTQVRFTVHDDRTWSATITAAPRALLDKLAVAAARPRSPACRDDACRPALEALLPVVARQIEVRFDDTVSPANLSIVRLEIPADSMRPSFVVLRADGTIPRNARSVRWTYRLAYSTYALTFVGGGLAAPRTVWIEGDAASPPLALGSNGFSPMRLRIIRQYLVLGFLHILPRGFDHILFVLGIFLLTPRRREIVAQVTAFTVAHSITLGLSLYGIVSLPSRVVEPLIALSIAYVAVENVITVELKPWRPLAVFAFGLLHGLGFAGVLRSLNLPRSEFVPALVSFNLGIELAQMAVVAAAYASTAAWFREREWYRPRFVIPASSAIAVTGVVWTVMRIARF